MAKNSGTSVGAGDEWLLFDGGGTGDNVFNDAINSFTDTDTKWNDVVSSGGTGNLDTSPLLSNLSNIFSGSGTGDGSTGTSLSGSAPSWLKALGGAALGMGTTALGEIPNMAKRKNLIKASYYRNPQLMSALGQPQDYTQHVPALFGAGKYNKASNQIQQILESVLKNKLGKDVLVDTENQTQQLQ